MALITLNVFKLKAKYTLKTLFFLIQVYFQIKVFVPTEKSAKLMQKNFFNIKNNTLTRHKRIKDQSLRKKGVNYFNKIHTYILNVYNQLSETQINQT